MHLVLEPSCTSASLTWLLLRASQAASSDDMGSLLCLTRKQCKVLLEGLCCEACGVEPCCLCLQGPL